MQKYFKTSVFLLLAAVFLSVACKHSVHNEPAPVYTVSFDLNGGGGVTLDKQEITKNNKVTKPTSNPTRTGYIFQHWSKTPDGEAYNFDTPVVNSFKLFAVWKIQQYTVNFNLAGSTEGTAPDTQTIENGKTVTKPADPTRSGYSFKHWSKEDGGTAYDFATPVTGTFTLYAVWEAVSTPTSYTITFNLNGATEGTAPQQQTIENGKTVTKPADPTRSGYSFKHWSKEDGGAAYDFATPVTGSFTLYAVWEVVSTPTSYTVTFNLNGSTEGTAPTTQTIENGKTVTQPTNPSWNGHSFKHWSKGTAGAAYNFSDPVTGSFTLYAVWEKNDPSSPEPAKHTVTFNLDGGSGTAPVAQTIGNGNKVSKPADPSRSGYTFKHWSKDQNGTTAYNFNDPVTGSFTLYAVWEVLPVQHTVTFNLDGGAGTTPVAQTIGNGNKVSKPSDPSRSGYTFKHWSKDQNGTTAYNFNDPVTGSFTLFAVWEVLPVQYTVTFNLDGGAGTAPVAQTIGNGNKVSKPADPSRSGYTFKHWSKDQNGTTAYNFNDPVTGSFTLFAVWEQNATPPPAPQTFTVSFDLDDGEGTPPANQIIESGHKVTEPPKPSRSGYDFKHWSQNKNGAKYDFDTLVTGSFTLFAVWEAKAPIPQEIKIYTIQGAAHESPLKGQSVTDVPGIVTAITYTKGQPTGFYMQDEHGDGNPVTSDGIFVYCGKDKVPVGLNIGDEVTVSGKVAEYIPNAKINNTTGKPFYEKEERLSITQLMSDAAKIQVKSHGKPLPDPIELTPDNMIKKVATGSIGSLEPDTEAIDYYESLEGMRVKVANPKVIAKNFGKTYYIAPYNAPSISYRGGMMYNSYDATAMIPVYTTNCFKAESDSGYSKEGANTTDSFNGDIIGVITYHNGDYTCAYQIALTEKLPPRIKGSLSPESSAAIHFDAAKLNVVSYNLKNFSAGNKSDTKRAEQFADHFINELKAPDIICLIEIQDDSGAKNDNEVDSKETLDLLINEMKEKDSSKLYKKIYINPQDGVDGGKPGSNIRCAYLYRADRVELVPDDDGTPTDADESDTKAEIIGTGTNAKLKANPARIGIEEAAFTKCRKSLVAHFKFKDSINDGKDFFMINNHFSSKRGDAPIWGAKQPVERKSEVNRHGQARIVKNFIDSILNARPDAMVISVGDYNDFWFSKTMEIMKGSNMKNAVEALPENERYTFVYDAHSQTLDNIIVPNRAGVTISGADILNVNSEFGGKLSDHDPVFVQLSW